MKKYTYILLGVLALVLNMLFKAFPGIYEVVYYKGIFQILRTIYDFTFGWLPFPMVYILFLVLIIIIANFLKFSKVRKATSALDKTKVLGLQLLSFVGIVVFLFYFLWGFHYVQQPLAERLDFPEVKADTTALFEESLVFANKLNELRKVLSTDTIPLDASYIPEALESKIRQGLTTNFDNWGLPTNGRVRVRTLHPNGTLLRISTAGVYIPFVFEGHIDAGLHPIQKPFILAHEMSHGYGIADEGTCNFTGFVACINVEDTFVQYSGVLGVWRYMANSLRRSAPHSYKKMMRTLDNNVKRDLNAITHQMNKYPDILPDLRDVVYDTYLKSHGVQQGLSNYGTVVGLYMAWQEKQKK